MFTEKLFKKTPEQIARIAARRKKRQECLLRAMRRETEALRAEIQRAREAARGRRP